MAQLLPVNSISILGLVLLKILVLGWSKIDIVGPRHLLAGAPNGNFQENICSEDDLRSRIFGAFVVKFLACLPLLGFSNIYKVV